MKTVNMHEAKTHLSRLVDEAAAGEPVVIAKAGKPVARIVPLEAPPDAAQRRFGFLKGLTKVPDDFNRMGEDEIVAMFRDEP